MSIVQAINDAIKERGKPQQITELLLTDIEIVKFTPEVIALLDKCKKIEVLELSSCRLESLEGLPIFPKLKVVDLSDNKLTDKDLETLAKIPTLNQIFLEKNNIETVAALDALKVLKDLDRLEFGENPITEEDNYRQKVLDGFPQLQVLDEKDRDGNELPAEEGDDEEEEEGSEYDEESGEDEDSAYSDEYESEEEKPTKKRKTK